MDVTAPEADAPRADTWFTPRAPAAKRRFARAVATANRALDRLAFCRWLYRRQLRATLAWTELELPVADRRLDGLTAVFLSDLHAGSYLDGDDLDWLFTAVAARGPELVLFGGDLVHTRPRELGMYDAPLARLNPPLGCFAVPGNHERFPDIGLDRWRAHFECRGVTVLIDRGVRIAHRGAGLWLAGVDELSEGRPDPAAALAGRDPREPAVVLSHHPDLFPALAELGADLVLSGHTHGGQIAPFGRVLLRHSERGYHRGRHRCGAATLYVGRGIGAAILPVRWEARPEVVVVTARAG